MLEVLRNSCPFPTIDDTGELRDGLNVAQPKRCRKCSHKSCREHLKNKAPERVCYEQCEVGYSLLLIPTKFGTLLVNGVHVPFHNNAMDAKAKKANRSQKVTWEQAAAYAQSLESSTKHILGAIQREVQETVAGLHDINTAISLVFRNAEGLIRGLPGYDDHDRIENAEPNLKRLLKSVSLIKSRLDLVSLIANPESASYGQPRSTPVYKVFHRMVRLFEEEAARRHLRINMRGQSLATEMSQ